MSVFRSDDEAAARPPTLIQVAALAGVSLKTASRALNNEPMVAPDTGRRVREAAGLLGYRLNGIARDMRRGATSTLVGLVGGDPVNPFYSAVASGIERELRQHGLQLVTANSDGDAERERGLIETLLERRVRALMVVPNAFRLTYLTLMGGGDVPFVFLDRLPDGISADSVVIDNAGGSQAAAQHLLDRGHRRIALIAGLADKAPQRERIAAFVRTLSFAGDVDWEPFLRVGVLETTDAEYVVRGLSRLEQPPTAIFTCSNRLTTGALRALRDAPYRPALIGFDDFDLADVTETTVISHDTVALGRRAAQVAYERISGYGGVARTVIIPTTVIARGSGERLRS